MIGRLPIVHDGGTDVVNSNPVSGGSGSSFPAPNPQNASDSLPINETTSSPGTGTGANSSPGSDNTIYYIAGAAILLFLITRKK